MFTRVILRKLAQIFKASNQFFFFFADVFLLNISCCICFIVNIAELRMQLQLLKRETTNSGDGTELFILGDDKVACQPLPEIEESQVFRDEEERDFSYVLDMLTGLGIHTANQDDLLENCYLLECPGGPDLYDELENKYSCLILWPPAERKLLFDITSAVLQDIITSLMQLFKGIVEDTLAKMGPG